MKILFVISEVEGLVKTGGLADVGYALPIELRNQGHDVRIVIPFYKTIAQKFPAHQASDGQMLYANDRQYHYNIKQLELDGLCVYGVDFPLFFDRDGIYSDSYHAYPDNAERYAFFSMAALHASACVGFQPDIVHCHDWHTALVPFFLKRDPTGFYHKSRSVLTIHNGAYQCQHAFSEIPFLHPYEEIAQQQDPMGAINFLKIGVMNADKINAVSPHYGNELKTPLGSHQMFHEFMTRQHDLTGILNGCDYSQWDPATDKELPANFHAEDISGKAICKEELQKAVGLEVNPNVPLIGMVCRLTDQKGFAYLTPILGHLLQHNVQLLIIGTGDPVISEALRFAASQRPDKFVFREEFSNHMAHLLEAGSDYFLMPSLFEPCGLNQMYSLAYGTLPIVRAVGGLRDTVIDLEEAPEHATGFVFHSAESNDLLHCLRRAILFYYEYPDYFKEVQHRAMRTRFTWFDAANQYVGLYEDALRS
ncbi:MAG: glycogen synthase GlgA [Alteromonadaceae bacterium]|nr:glycogen synthase GlgA [Alteromonadaceae bacterium]